MEQMNYPTRKDFFNAFGKLTINEIKDGLLLRTKNSHIKYNEIVKDFKRHLNLNDIRPDVDTQSLDRFLGYEENELVPFTDDEIWLFEFDLDEHKRPLFDFITMEDKGVNISQTKVSCNWEDDTEEFLKLAFRTFKFREACKIVISQLMEQSEHPEAVKPDEVLKKELYNHIFKGNAFEVFEKYHSTKRLAENSKTDLNLLFQLFENDNLFVETVELKHYIKWLNSKFEYSLTELKKVNINSKPNIQRANDYKEYKKLTLKQP